jgi:hypothetical protein
VCPERSGARLSRIAANKFPFFETAVAPSRNISAPVVHISAFRLSISAALHINITQKTVVFTAIFRTVLGRYGEAWATASGRGGNKYATADSAFSSGWYRDGRLAVKNHGAKQCRRHIAGQLKKPAACYLLCCLLCLFTVTHIAPQPKV